MRTVSARDANQRFSKLLAEAEQGQDVVITKRGRPVARLVAYSPQVRDEDRQAALDRLMKGLKKGVRMGGRRFTRDEMHER